MAAFLGATPHRTLSRGSSSGSPLWIGAGGEQVELPDLTGPTDKGPSRRRPALELEDAATDEGPVLLRLAPALPPAVRSPDSLPPLRIRPDELVAAALPPPVAPAADENSTGLFESWDWDEADPYTTGEFPSVPAGLAHLSRSDPSPASTTSAPPESDPYLSRSSRHAPRDLAWEREMTGPRLAVVQDAPADDEDYDDVRAAPMPIPPRPSGAEVGGPWRAFRPAPIEVPEDWLDDRQDTLVVIDPTLRAPGRPWVVVALMDAGAWAFGFAMTFLTGLLTSASASVVLVAIS